MHRSGVLGAALDRATRALARTAVATFYREVSVVGAARIPRDAPLVVVANHPNGLVDPALVAGFLPIRARFLAKSPMWANVALRPLLALAGALPAHRRQDPGGDPTQNRATFAACNAALASGEAVALFPEGHSHGGPGLLTLKTGAARIAYGAPGARVVPVDLDYEAKDRFRSRVRVVVGEALELPPVASVPGGERDAVRLATARIAEALAALARARPGWRPERRLVVRRAWLGLVAIAFYAIPCALAALVGRWSTRRIEMRASHTIVAALYLVPAAWAAELAAATRLAGAQWAVALGLCGATGTGTALALCDAWRARRFHPKTPLVPAAGGSFHGPTQAARRRLG